MRQTKLESLIEAIVNTAVGFVITMTFYPFINYLCGVKMSIAQTSLSTALFTIISVLRGYVIRRYFNNLHYIKSHIQTFIIKLKKP